MAIENESQPQVLGAVLRVTGGNLLEQLDFFLFGFYATYIARTFFRPRVNSPR